jgi:hypothetical protein
MLSIAYRKEIPMKSLVYFFAILSILMFSCSLPSTATPTSPPVVTEPPAATETPLVTEPPVITEAPTASEPAPPAPNAFCNELSLYLDPTLANSITCEVIPASTLEMDIHPEYTKMTLIGYPLQNKFFPPNISIFPVQAYDLLMPNYLPDRVSELQTLIAGGLPGTSGLPFLPIFNAAQAFHANYALNPFVSGGGIRFLTLYAQYFAPVNNQDLFYTYQGLTNDGQYWVSAILPINHVILPETADPPPGGMTWDQFSANYDVYIADMITQLEAQIPDSYLPSLTALDTLVTSITILP